MPFSAAYRASMEALEMPGALSSTSPTEVVIEWVTVTVSPTAACTAAARSSPVVMQVLHQQLDDRSGHQLLRGGASRKRGSRRSWVLIRVWKVGS